MNLRKMLIELNHQRRALDRAIAALEALQKKPRTSRKNVVRGRATAEAVEFKGRKLGPRKNGTTGLLIPFSPGRNQE